MCVCRLKIVFGCVRVQKIIYSLYFYRFFQLVQFGIYADVSFSSLVSFIFTLHVLGYVCVCVCDRFEMHIFKNISFVILLKRMKVETDF